MERRSTLAEIRIKQRERTQVRDGECLNLRLAGATYADIAKIMGMANKAVARNACQRAMGEARARRDWAAEGVKDLELARLDKMLVGVWQKATSGSEAAIAAVLRIMERRAAYIGLDAPKRTEVTGADGGPIEVETLVLTEEDRDRRIFEIVEQARARLDIPALPEAPNLAAPGGTADSSVA